MGEKKKRNKNIQIGKEIKLSLFTDDIVLYTGKPKESTHAKMRIYQFSKIAGLMINIKTQLYFHTLAMNNPKVK